MWCRVSAHLNLFSWSLLERSVLESDSLVDKISTVIAQHKISAPRIGRTKTAELTANLKYELKSDREIVPWGKAEKHL